MNRKPHFLLAGLLAATSAIAQTPADLETARRQAETTQRLEQQRIERDIDAARRPEAPPGGIDTGTLVPPVDASGVGPKCRDIREIVIEGAEHLDADFSRRLHAEFEGRCLGVAEIERILGEITREYIQRGFVTTRAYLPQQDLSTGTLKILVVEGRIESIRIEENGRTHIRPWNAIPADTGDLLNLRDLEQGIDQINRLASNDATLDIRPGSEPGKSEVVISNTARPPVHLLTSYDNQGSEGTGRKQFGATLGFDNLFGFNEYISVGRRESWPHEDGRFSLADTVSFNVPFGYSTFSFNHSRSHYESPIALPSGLVLTASGDSQTENFSLDRVMYRDQSVRANLSAGVTTKKSHNYLAGELLGVSSRQLTILDVDGRVSTAFLGGSLMFELGWAQGMNFAGALTDADNLPYEAPRAQFQKLKYGARFARSFKLGSLPMSFSSQLTGQHAYDTLYGSEQILIGGIYTVRGFVNSTLSGDDGYYIRNELAMQYPIPIAGQNISTRVYLGLDHGEVRNRVANIPEGRLTGAAIGASLAWAGAAWEIFHARPIDLPDTLERESGQTWFRVSYGF